jgi:hypothetical protein
MAVTLLPCCVIEWTHSTTISADLGTGRSSLRSLMKKEGLAMNAIVFLSLVIILSAALPWWPYSAYGRLRHHRPWDWLLDNLSWDQRREALG